jgi:hypothetical protein
MRYGAHTGKVGGKGMMHASLPSAACIHENVSSAPFPAASACRGSTSDAWASNRRGVGPDASLFVTKKDKQTKVMIIFISQAPKDLTGH